MPHICSTKRRTRLSAARHGILALIVAFGVACWPAAAVGQQPAPSGERALVGQVVDSESLAPLSTVEVRVLAGDDSAVVETSLTDRAGRFRMSGIPLGSYQIVFSRLGYSEASVEIGVQGGGDTDSAVDVGAVSMTPSAVELAEVNVLGERSAVIVAADRDIYLVEGMPAAAGGSATEVLENIPDLEVDINGRVTLRGENPAIYINGREAPMDGESLDIFLQNFPAENIENVEVMANPSARYDAEGAGGIVNIVLKQGVSLGVTGNAFVNGGTRGQVGAGGRATYQSGPLTMMGGASLRWSRNEVDTFDLRQNLLADPITWLEQDGFSDRSNWTGNFDLRTQYAFGEDTELTAEARVYRNGSDAERLTTYTEMDDEQVVLDQYDRVSVDAGHGSSADVALELEHEFGERGRELTVELEYERGLDGDESRITRRVLEELGVVDFATELTWDEERETESELGFDLDYTHPLGELSQLEVGYQGEFGETDESQFREVEIQTDPVTPIESVETGFLHSQSVNAGYFTLMRRFGELSAQVGLRGEYTATRLELPGEPQAFTNDHFAVFPNANLSYSFEGGKRLRLSYSMRIRRPSSRVLNPTNRSDDPLDREVGNPDIDPQTTHSVGLDATWSGEIGMLRFSPFYRYSLDEWEQFQTVDEQGVATTTWENLGQTESLGASLSASVRDYHGFGGQVSLNGQRQEYNWGAVLDQPSTTSVRWSVRTNLRTRVTSSLNLQGALTYNPPRDLPQGRTSATVMTRLGIRQRLLDGRASLNLNVTDPFDIYRSSIRRSDTSYVQVGRERESARRLNVSLSYTFGGEGRGGGRNGGGFRGGGPGRGPR